MTITDRIFIWLRFNEHQQVSWCAHINGHVSDIEQNTLAQLGQMLCDVPYALAEVVVLVPGEMIFSDAVNITSQQLKYAQQALPFLMEDQLSDDIENMHFVLGAQLTSQQYTVFCVAKSTLTSWLSLLQQHNITAHLMVADSYCVPALADQIHVLVDKIVSLIKLDDGQAYSVDTSNITTLLPALIAERDRQAQSVLVQITQTELLPESFAAQLLDQPLLSFLSQTINHDFAAFKKINLLQGAYAPKKSRQQVLATPFMRWKKVLTTTATLLVALLIIDVVEGLYLQHKTTALNSEIKAYYQQLFPQDTQIVNIKSQMISHLKAVQNQSSNTSFLNLLSVVSNTLDKHGLQASFEVNQLNYLSDKNELTIEFVVNNFEQLNQFKTWLNQEGVNAEIGSVTTENNKTKATLRAWQS